LALVGFGRIAPKHLEVYRALGAEIVGCCNRTADGRENAQREGGISRTYEHIGEMLDRERPDGVVCSVSFDQNYTAGLEVLEHGIPMFLEKPPGTSLDKFRHLCRVADNKRVPVMVGLNRRHYSVVRKALDDAGGMEKITAVMVEWSEDPHHLFVNRGFTAEQASLWVFGNTLHGLDLMTYLAGAIEKPTVMGLNLGQPLRWMMALQGVSERGAMATFNSTWDSPARWRVSFCTPGRRYLFAPLETCQVSETGVKETRSIDPDDVDVRFKAGFYAQARAFLETIRSGRVSPLYSLASAEPAMRLAEALTAACREARRDATARQGGLAASSDNPSTGRPCADGRPT